MRSGNQEIFSSFINSINLIRKTTTNSEYCLSELLISINNGDILDNIFQLPHCSVLSVVYRFHVEQNSSKYIVVHDWLKTGELGHKNTRDLFSLKYHIVLL